MEDIAAVELEGQTSIEDALLDAGHPWTSPKSQEDVGQLALF